NSGREKPPEGNSGWGKASVKKQGKELKEMGIGVLRKGMMVLLVLGLLFGGLPWPGTGEPGPEVYAAAPPLEITRTGASSATQQEADVPLSFTLRNTGSSAYTYSGVSLVFENDQGLTVSGGSSGSVTLAQGEETTVLFYVDVSRSAATGSRSYALHFTTASGTDVSTRNFSLTIYENIATPSQNSGAYIASVDISHQISPEGGLVPGNENTITFQVFNKGNVMIRDAQLVLTMPEGLSVYNESNTVSLGYLGTSSTRKSVSVPVQVNDSVTAGLYAVTAQVQGFNYRTGDALSEEKTFYIPVEGSGGVSSRDLGIENVTAPSTVNGSAPFNLSFSVANKGQTAARNLRVSVELPEGILNRTQTSFVESSLGAGESRNYSFTLFAADNIEEKNYPLRLVVEFLDDGEQTPVSQYAGVYIAQEQSSGGDVKTPQLMVSNYSYGGSSVQAGTEFYLGLNLLNTSGATLSNIKVTVSAEAGAMVPVDSSNAFFIRSIGGGGAYSGGLRLSVDPQAEQKTTTITVSMRYEDGDGNEYSSEDIISVPVTQETRLVVDDVMSPMESYVGEQGSAEIAFYNMGKTTLNNLRINAEGEFDVWSSNSYYVGNMESGRSDSYTFTFVPREAGPFNGAVTFTYEDSAGAQQYLEVPFTFQAVEMPIWDEEPMPIEEPEGGVPWSIIIGAAAVLLVGGIIAARKIRKRRMHKAVEMEDAELEIPDENGGENGEEK
ncbi:MAG: NEW3 domain-containing protein, partial [Bacillota bacterium]|nr:NEW3 domain-containing protein [Bacillota bacterium]